MKMRWKIQQSIIKKKKTLKLDLWHEVMVEVDITNESRLDETRIASHVVIRAFFKSLNLTS